MRRGRKPKMGDMDAVWEAAREIAGNSSDALSRTAVIVRPVRSVAANVEQAHKIAERFRRPVDTLYDGHPVTVFPIGQTPA